ncbi:MAG: hypothetical protein SGJ01_00155 [Gemmatimonadota bacterium]|nr:hypothetical protein [Gemmatimonadota bacterium]
MKTARLLPRFILLMFSSMACGGGDTNSPAVEGVIARVTGDGQSATVGTALQPYQVKVTGQGTAPTAGATVQWAVVSGGGSVSAATSVTDAAGLAEITATISNVIGAQVVRAVAPGLIDSLVTFTSTGTADVPALAQKTAGDGQTGTKALPLSTALAVRVTDQFGNVVAGVTVSWLVIQGGGAVASLTSITSGAGLATVTWTLGASAGASAVTATVAGLAPLTFTATAVNSFVVLSGGSNVPERYGSDLWVADGYGYSGTWGFRSRAGNAVKIWQLNGTGAPTLVDSIITVGIGTVSDIEVSPDGRWLVFTAEGGSENGIHVFELTAPGVPVFRAKSLVGTGLHTGTLAVIGGKLYAFTAKDPGSPALIIYDLSQAASGVLTPVSSTPIPPNYGIHDTFVRDGYAFVFAWDEGLYIFDVGNGSNGGSVAAPVQVSHTAGFGGETHNGWWFHNPTTNEKKYLFIGEEGPGGVGTSSSGDIHVVDVSNLSAPVEVASFHLPGAGVHNFWMDEPAQRLYAAYYNGGVVALDVSGTLSGNLGSRLISQLKPGGTGQTYVWGVMLYNGSLYVSDMLSGFWQLSVP